MRMNWFEGYVGEDEYASGYYENLSPNFISFAAFVNGYLAPDVARPFNFIDIASGQGISTILHAVLFPHGHFYGIDLSPSHIAKSRDLASRVGLDNISFIESNVRELETLDLPDMDFAVAQGVYSWLNSENQTHIIKFLRKKLKPRGIFSIHYMAYPGALQGEVLPKLLSVFAQNQTGSNESRLKDAINKFEKFSQASMGFFGDGENIKKHISRYHSHDLKHLAHDLLSKDRRGHFFSEMAQDLAQAKLSYIGSTNLTHTFPITSIFPKTKNIVELSKDDIIKNSIIDYASRESTRRDIFQRGPKAINHIIMAENLKSMQFFRTAEVKDMKKDIKLANVSFSIQEAAFKAISSAMDNHIFSGSEIIEKLQLSKNSIRDIITNISLFIIAGYIKPIPKMPDSKLVLERAGKFNNYVLNQHLVDSNVLAIASPSAGVGVNINNIERMILRFIIADPKISKKSIKEQIEKEMEVAGISISVNTPDPEDSDKIISSPLKKEQLSSLVDNFLKNKKKFFQNTKVI